MALVLPLLLVLMFSFAEAGNYVMNEHGLVKAVRDGARFAARQDFSNYTGCSGIAGRHRRGRHAECRHPWLRSGGTNYLAPNISHREHHCHDELRGERRRPEHAGRHLQFAGERRPDRHRECERRVPLHDRGVRSHGGRPQAQCRITSGGDRPMIRKLLLDRTAASAAEFALVLPLLLVFLLGNHRCRPVAVGVQRGAKSGADGRALRGRHQPRVVGDQGRLCRIMLAGADAGRRHPGQLLSRRSPAPARVAPAERGMRPPSTRSATACSGFFRELKTRNVSDSIFGRRASAMPAIRTGPTFPRSSR